MSLWHRQRRSLAYILRTKKQISARRRRTGTVNWRTRELSELWSYVTRSSNYCVPVRRSTYRTIRSITGTRRL